MSSVIKFNQKMIDVSAIAEEGRQIYKSNPFMRSLTNIMENPEFSDLFKNYFNAWDNIEIFVMFAKVYESITKQFPEMSGYEKISLVKKFIDNSKTRQLIGQEIIKFRETKNNQLNTQNTSLKQITNL